MPLEQAFSKMVVDRLFAGNIKVLKFQRTGSARRGPLAEKKVHDFDYSCPDTGPFRIPGNDEHRSFKGIRPA
jgi:hypothetical protein